MSECGITVAVRLRPFSDRERTLGAELCVSMDGPCTTLHAMPEATTTRRAGGGDSIGGRQQPDRSYNFDASFWSHDGFSIEDATGYACPLPGSCYADQRLVFGTLGEVLLEGVWSGQPACLFAYGQTGAGKSYSMVGYGANRGLIPMACEELFKRISTASSLALQCTVSVSMVEIYNEIVQDLLIHPKKRSKKGLNIRENKVLGVYIEGAEKRAAGSYLDVQKTLEEGTRHRTMGATVMNSTSSRAHTVLALQLQQSATIQEKLIEYTSTMHLVDLAGSERTSKEDSKDRLKESSAINKSLSALGKVVDKLCDKSSGLAPKNAPVPYRESKLTRLLQNALGGSSKTVMLCAVSPASINYDETLSTLRYAERAKNIKNTVNASGASQGSLLEELRQQATTSKENREAAKAKDWPRPEGADLRTTSHAADDSTPSLADCGISSTVAEASTDASAQLGPPAEVVVRQPSVPHLANLNEDDMLTNKLHFELPKGITSIGKDPKLGPMHQRSQPCPDIVLAGPGIYVKQAAVDNDGSRCQISSDGPAILSTKVNGHSQPAKSDGVVLEHGDRLAFGTQLFVFVDPVQGSADELLRSGKVSHVMAMKELTGGSASGHSEDLAVSTQRAEELEKKAAQAEDAKRQAEAEAAALREKREAEWSAHLEELQREEKTEEREKQLEEEFKERAKQEEEESKRRIEELEAEAARATVEEAKQRRRRLNLQRLDEKLMHLLPLIKEANYISQELLRPYRFELKMEIDVEDKFEGDVLINTSVFCDDIHVFHWSPETLENRVYLMRELLERHDAAVEEGGDTESFISKVRRTEDPFWDPVQTRRQVGISQMILAPLAEQYENVSDLAILSTEGAHAGTLHVELWPVSSDGELGIPDEEVVEELVGKRMELRLKVVSASGIASELATDVSVEYFFFLEAERRFVPALDNGLSVSPRFDYEEMKLEPEATAEDSADDEEQGEDVQTVVVQESRAAAAVVEHGVIPGLVAEDTQTTEKPADPLVAPPVQPDRGNGEVAAEPAPSAPKAAAQQSLERPCSGAAGDTGQESKQPSKCGCAIL
eukprot:TRINITY_DN15934_c0_g1_i1.p1 TRINITY_DN15934_c0_g1~~TRINITY_DN15934_c0_g1_i1.p1  ORF type:complete len:1063 (-),score=264.26 TRINITY_DN15934_c0_g1_i1:107-3295(-)